MDINISQIEVKIKLVESEKLLATAILKYGPFVWKGFRIMKSDYENEGEEKFWIQPPSYRTRQGKFVEIFFCEDKELWKQIEAKIIFGYKNTIIQNQKYQEVQLTEVDYEKIDKSTI